MKSPEFAADSLDQQRFLRTSWLVDRGFVGIVKSGVPGKQDFESLLEMLRPISAVTIFHAEFNKQVFSRKVNDYFQAYSIFFSCIHEDTFVFVESTDVEYLLWIPHEHEFHAIFGPRSKMESLFGMQKDVLIADFEAYMRDEVFNERSRNRFINIMHEYFSL